MTALIIGIPAHRERHWLPKTLAALAVQDDMDFEVHVFINQPEAWVTDPDHTEATAENLATIDDLNQIKYPFPLHIWNGIDQHPLPGKGGVGLARRFLFDRIVAKHPQALCCSLDADTHVEPNYTNAIRKAFQQHPNASAMAVPYYHPLPEDPDLALHLLRYEIYMRYYQLSLWRIGSPYAFLPLGSAIAFPASVYHKVHGMPDRRAGEDFYFLQQLRKIGPIIRWAPLRVYPASRPSDRVPFGTGPLLLEQNLEQQTTRFPFYRQEAFDLLRETFQKFSLLHQSDLSLPIQSFIDQKMGGSVAFDRMRRNFKSNQMRFIKACHEKIDALKTLQFLRHDREQNGGQSPQQELNNLLNKLQQPPAQMVFQSSQIRELDLLRDRLAKLEADFQKEHMNQWDLSASW